MQKTEDKDTLVFMASVKADKHQIKRAVKKLYDIDLAKGIGAMDPSSVSEKRDEACSLGSACEGMTLYFLSAATSGRYLIICRVPITVVVATPSTALRDVPCLGTACFLRSPCRSHFGMHLRTEGSHIALSESRSSTLGPVGTARPYDGGAQMRWEHVQLRCSDDCPCSLVRLVGASDTLARPAARPSRDHEVAGGRASQSVSCRSSAPRCAARRPAEAALHGLHHSAPVHVLGTRGAF
ncbi:60S ribosomal protein L23a [Galemys pyrenaicus]|uniref:60S ribosomal protein L23a n=1 Tax=Galemys pyrenaicus TaxID=202257 RepID=A0A8J6A977_GALPY|nr:60S ribosomal protein L23a [Galemys pyrenaicus]